MNVYNQSRFSLRLEIRNNSSHPSTVNHYVSFCHFLTFPACFSIPIIFSNFDFNCSNLSSLRNLQEQVKKAFCYQELFWPFTVWINCSSDLKKFENSRPSASIFKTFSRSLEQYFLTVGQNNFGNKIPNLPPCSSPFLPMKIFALNILGIWWPLLTFSWVKVHTL